MQRKNILLLFGGESPEHNVSIISARNVFAALDNTKYDVHLSYITQTGQWLYVHSLEELDSSLSLTPLLGQRSFQVSDGTVLSTDVMLPILHGVHGEDGEVQGLASLLHLPCVGPSLIGAAVTMNKDVTKRLLRDAGIPVSDWLSWHTFDPQPMYANVREKLGSTVFVKPANAGSSVGVSKVHGESEYHAALELAARYDTHVLIEQAIDAREIEVAVIGNNKLEASVLGEIIPGQEFYSYDDKYAADSAAVAKIPAELDPKIAERIRAYALTAYRATCGHGMARLDFFLDTQDSTIYLNEINAIPGFTNISMYPKLWQHQGLSYAGLLDKLISLACNES